MPKARSIEGFLLDHPNQIDDFLGAKLITEETAQEIRKLLSTRSKQESGNTIEDATTEGNTQRIESSESQEKIPLYCILGILLLGGILFWKQANKRKNSL